METIDFENRQKKAFIDALGQVPQEYSAARIAKIPIALVKGWYSSDPDFNAACSEIKEELLDRVEAKAYTMALDGSEQMMRFVLERQRKDWAVQQTLSEEKITHRIRDFSGSWVGEEDAPVDAEFEEVADK